MGYDLKGMGFLTDYITALDDDDGDKAILDEKQGVVRSSEDNKILRAKSDYISIYIMSDNYMYTLKNNNLVTLTSANNWLENVIAAIGTAYYKTRNFVMGPVLDYIGVTDGVTEAWGRGLIAIYREDGKNFGKRGHIYNNNDDIFSWLTTNRGKAIKMDAKQKTMTIQRSSIFDYNAPMKYSLDGWTGRYGMPLEFLLSIHLATQMPDLAFDMVTSFPTNINMYLHDVTGEIVTVYKGPEGQISSDNLRDDVYNNNEESGDFSGRKSIKNMDKRKLAELVENGLDLGKPSLSVFGYSDEPDYVNVIEYNGGYLELTDNFDTFCVLESQKEEGKEYIKHPDKDIYYNDEIIEEYLQSSPTPRQFDADEKIYKNYFPDDDTDVNMAEIITELSSYDKNYKTYIPYIASVTDHWFRDVYFIYDTKFDEKSLSFVDYDYDYEALMKERWTLYETYKKNEGEPEQVGTFKLYKVNDDGSYGDLYNGTQEQADKEEIRVSKKPVTIEASDTDTLVNDLGWLEINGVWSAYEEKKSSSSGELQPKYGDDQENGKDEEGKDLTDVQKNTYVRVNTNSNIAQKGEGQRTETNPKIKKMFSTNKYFRYLGDPQTAEIITDLRKSINGSDDKIYYGPIVDKSKGIDYSENSITKDGKEFVAKDYISNVSLEQDSLNAFSILENTHTLDSDYIYRDFKELVVELGYFEKEELTDEMPRLLQWLVPDTGSYGYPYRLLDKNENEFGSMIHSKGDIDCSKDQLAKKYRKGEGGETSLPPDPGESSDENVASLNTKSKDLTSVAGVDVEVTNTTDFKQDSWLATCQACWEYLVKENNRLEGAIGYADGGTSPMPFAESQSEQKNSGDMIDCSGFTCWCLNRWFKDDRDDVSEFFAEQRSTSEMVDEDYNEMFGLEEIPIAAGEDARPKLEPGDILVRWNGDDATHHVCICKEVQDDGTVWTYDCGSQSHWNTMDNLDHTTTRESFVGVCDAPGKIIRIDSTVKKKGEMYTGYNGNEAVVSPVTGVLLEYGTYSDEKDSITDEEYRINVDYKYNNNKIEDETNTESGEGNNNNNNNNPTPNENTIPIDKVGYAKILVLDEDTYANLEKQFINEVILLKDLDNTSYGRISLLDEDPTFLKNEEQMKKKSKEAKNPDSYEGWNDKQKLIYGYKKFLEDYVSSGIAGNIVYIDGFVCEYPEETDNKKSDFIPNENTDENDIKFDDFKKITESSFSNGDLNNDDEILQTLYEKEDEHKMASKSATDRLNAKSAVKEMANSSYYTGGKIKINLGKGKLSGEGADASSIKKEIECEGIFIKEGTVIGRTMTDKELLDGNIRENKDGTYDSIRKDDEKNHVIGNYLRIMMLDDNYENVENVENYLKLDDGEIDNQELGMEKFLFWMGCLAEGGHLKNINGTWYSVAVNDGVGTSSEPGKGLTHFFGLTNYDMDQYEKATGKREWKEEMPLEELVNTYLIMIGEDIDWVKEKLGEDIEDGYLQGFISLAHNFGKVYPHPPPHEDFNWRADEYLQSNPHQVSEETWARDYSYSDRPEMDKEMEKRRRNEYSIVSKGVYPAPYSDDHDTEYDWASYSNPETPGVDYNLSEETPFTDWLNALGIKVTADVSFLDEYND